ncbi:MAG: hypothetical protein Kapaf2KO_18350 [Candidatus Kapaibacteriales bacterium]
MRFWSGNPAVNELPIIVSVPDYKKVENSGSANLDKSSEDFLLEKYLVNPSNLFEEESKEEKVLISSKLYKRLQEIDEAVVIIANEAENGFLAIKSIAVEEPLIYFPFNPALGHTIKNLNFHLPMSWVATLAFLISAVFGGMFLKTGKNDYDIISYSSAAVGLFMACLAMATGMIWARYSWGMYWSNDPRQISLAVLLIIYLAYVALRYTLGKSPKTGKLSAVYSIISFVSAIFFLFVAPRMQASLHPGGATDESLGPVVDFGKGMLDSSLALVFYFSLFAYILVYFILSNMLATNLKLKENVMIAEAAALENRDNDDLK